MFRRKIKFTYHDIVKNVNHNKIIKKPKRQNEVASAVGASRFFSDHQIFRPTTEQKDSSTPEEVSLI